MTGAGEVNVKCGVLINCTYNGSGLEGHGKGPLLSTATNGEVTLEEQETNRVKGFCPETAKIDLLTTPLSATNVKLMRCELEANGNFLLQVSLAVCSGVQPGEGEYELFWL